MLSTFSKAAGMKGSPPKVNINTPFDFTLESKRKFAFKIMPCAIMHERSFGIY
jgi:hypothetical protein